MINPAIYGAFHLRRPRTTKLRNSTVVLSAAAFRKPSSNSPSVATTTLGRRRNQKKSHHTRVRHYLISKSPSNTLPVYASQQHEPGELPKMEVRSKRFHLAYNILYLINRGRILQLLDANNNATRSKLAVGKGSTLNVRSKNIST